MVALFDNAADDDMMIDMLFYIMSSCMLCNSLTAYYLELLYVDRIKAIGLTNCYANEVWIIALKIWR
jgi:hypothetical protein